MTAAPVPARSHPKRLPRRWAGSLLAQYINGDLTGFSVVEVATDEVAAGTHPGSAVLSGYVSPS